MVELHRPAVDALVVQLDRRGAELGLPDEGFARLSTAVAAQTLLADLAGTRDDLGRVNALVAASIPMAPLTLAKSITTARTVADEMEAAQFGIITAAMSRSGPQAEALRVDLEAALTADEFVTPVVPVLHDVQRRAVELLKDAPAPGRGPGPAGAGPGVGSPPPPPPPAPPGLVAKDWSGGSAAEARAQLGDLDAKVAAGIVDPSTVQVHIAWAERESAAEPPGGDG